MVTASEIRRNAQFISGRVTNKDTKELARLVEGLAEICERLEKNEITKAQAPTHASKKL